MDSWSAVLHYVAMLVFGQRGTVEWKRTLWPAMRHRSKGAVGLRAVITRGNSDVIDIDHTYDEL